MPTGVSDRLSFDARTALLVVDVQNDFADPRGNLYVAGGECVVGVINELVGRARAADALVVYTQDWHPEQTPHFRDQGGTWPVHCVRDTWGAELIPELRVDGPIIKKGTGGEDGYSGFSVRDARTGATTRTVLDALLRRHQIEKVVVVGLAEDVCVKETALDAGRLGYETFVLRDATRPVDPANAEQGRRELAAAGVHLS
jgi:nicotinamidase/pyrazinamidase